MAIAKQLTVMLENRPGALAQLCSELAKVAVNINAIQAVEGSPVSTVRLLVSHLQAAEKVCDALRLKHAAEDVLAVIVGDRPGALGRLTRKLGEKGINIQYLYGTIDKSSKRALIVLAVSDVAAASRVVH